MVMKTLNSHIGLLFSSKQACRYLLLMALFMLPLRVFSAQIETSITPQTLRMNEAFQLTFSVEGSSGGEPDFSPLNEHFEVLSQRQSSQSSWTNGSTTQSVSWLLNLMPRKQGAVVVPAISFGQDASEPLTVDIEAEQSAAIFLKVATSPEKSYLQSQIIYTWQFYRRADIEIRNARMNEPKVENAVRLQLGDNRQFATRVDDVEYVVTEGRYAFFPQQSGILHIPPLILTAEMLDRDVQNNGGFFRFQSSTARRAISDAVDVTVLPIPPSYTALPWLAAQQLELSEKWSDEDLQLQVGESLTRTINLRATGVLKSQLPELNISLDETGLTAYADQPLLGEQVFSEGVSATREEKIAIIGARAGQYLLPAIEVAWFNTQTGKLEITRLASRSLTVTEAPDQIETGNVQQAIVTSSGGPGESIPEMPEVPENSERQWFWKVLSAFLACGWIMTIAFSRPGKEKNLSVDTGRQSKRLAANIIRKELKNSCNENNALAARQSLSDWSKLQYQSDTLSAIFPNCSVKLQQQIALLERSLYSRSDVNWKGSDLWEAFELSFSHKGATVKDEASLSPLSPLYPSES